MQVKILYCPPGSRFHLGEISEVRSTTLTDTAIYIHSDVLFGAFLYQLAYLYPEKVPHFIELFRNKQIQFSSAFYFLENRNNQSKIFFLPKPVSLNLIEVIDSKGESQHKKLKSIQFLSWKVWQKALMPQDWLNSELCHIIDGKFVVLANEISPQDLADLRIFAKDDTLKVRLHTTEETGNLYSQTDLFLLGNKNWQVHWYFLEKNLLSAQDNEIYQQVWQNVIKVGIGGERSTGAGKITHISSAETDTNFLQQESSQKVNFSLTIPQKNEIAHLLLYQSKLRGGTFLAENYRLKVVQSILEGAIQTQEIQGNIVEIGENKLRYGINFAAALPEKYAFTES
ncbi:type III-A CRISPR-associated RAMP protein Csm4 [Raineya orbicola]|uniref:CRISPR system Cms protein Csm4 n=1 Tax=Raineya orbicola TaxID=2016530 RepID=A0A2N3IBH7_9BACT|nr:type III-A CRISPR-associated RAMP protein Csm4 [Raineya orbicola]PKQ67671.1 CRISPR type III-A/MTUBE-associated RAMP protein Csm4 [Raineya orbicola]